MKIIMILLCALWIALTAEMALGQAQGTHWASPGGTGTGLSQSTPFKITDFWSVAQPGHTLCLLNGTYNEAPVNQSVINVTVSGTANNRITIKALNDGLVNIDGQYVNQPIAIGEHSYITLEGMDAYNSGWGVITAGAGSQGGTGIILRRMIAWNANSTLNVHIIQMDYTTDSLVEDSAAFGDGRSNYIAYDATRPKLRRFWGMFEADQGTGGPNKSIQVAYRSTGELVENVIATYNARTTGCGAVHPATCQPNPYGPIVLGTEGQNHRILGSITYLKSTDNFEGAANFLTSWDTIYTGSSPTTAV